MAKDIPFFILQFQTQQANKVSDAVQFSTRLYSLNWKRERGMDESDNPRYKASIIDISISFETIKLQTLNTSTLNAV